MIVTVTPNPALDLTWHVERIVPGGVHRADSGRARAGGKGLNVARVAHAEGAQTVAVATVGGATGDEFAAELRESGMPHTLVPVAAATRRSIALVDESLGDTTIVNERGIAPSPKEWDALRDAVRAALAASAGRNAGNGPTSGVSAGAMDADAGAGGRGDRRPSVLVVSGSLPPGTPEDVLPSLIALGRSAGATVIVDTSGPSLLQAADAGASVLKPNAAELAEATGLDDPLAGARELLRRGTELVLLSRGADGMLAVTSADGHATSAGEVEPALQVLSARLPAPLAGNPTGAGDAAVAACAVLLEAGVRDPETMLRRATAWSAAAVLMPLAGDIHPSWTELEDSVTVQKEDPR
ncbi:PfkB family carbohydrate kinase [Microbacterium sp.]|uniref:1-phosphofructokinase family hexose kinase n=1 Tax=Microbacterium sp. TaxID=51671 RepID=UPI002811BDC4|nr:PfkB family carbohydrate kinase [Microbacterium sp.]